MSFPPYKEKAGVRTALRDAIDTEQLQKTKRRTDHVTDADDIKSY